MTAETLTAETSATTPAARAPLVPMSTRLGPVHIEVTSIERALPVWRDLVGLTVLSLSEDELVLGTGGEALIVLHGGASGPVPPHTLGLYHVAIHVPARKDLARAIARLLAARYRNSPTDHLVTETTYLWDADGNGIELTFETPWRGRLDDSFEELGYAVAADGSRHSGREPVDLESMLGELEAGEDLSAPLPAGTRIGHVHLHVGDLDEAMRFWADTVGFERQMLARRFGMGDVRLDFEPHILAFNVWAGPNAAQRPAGAAGLGHFTIVLPDAESREAVAQRLEAAGHPVERAGAEWAARDPSGNRFRLALE